MCNFFNHWMLRLLATLTLLFGSTLAQALTLGISVNPDRVRANEAVRVAITVTNDSAASVSAVSLRALLPASGVDGFYAYQYVSGSGTCPTRGNGYCYPAEPVVWNLGLIAPGQGVTVSYLTTMVGAVASGTAVSFVANALVNGVQTLTANQAVTVDNDNALSLVVDANKDGVATGEQLSYSLTYGNRSAASVTGAVLSLPLPAGTTLVSASGGGTQSGNNVLWALNTLQAGQSGRQQVVVAVGNGLASGSLLPVNVASLAGFSALTGDELARASLVTRVQSSPVLGLAIGTNADPARPNDGVRSAYTVTNRSAAPVFGAVLRVRLPAAGIDGFYEYQTLSGGGTCPTRGNRYCYPAEFVNWNIGTLAPGASVTVLLAAQLSGAFTSGRLITYDAELRGDGVPMVLASHTIGVDGDNALSLAVDANRDSVAPGEQLTYTLSYGNRSGASVTGTTLTLPLPAGLGLVSASGGGVLNNRTLTWTLNTLQAGQSGRQQLVVAANAGLASGTLLPINAAVITGTSAVTGTEQARATLATRVVAAPALALAVALNGNPVRPDGAVRAAFTVSNRSAETVFGAVLRTRMPTDGIDGVYQYQVFSGGAVCPTRGNSYCYPYEFVDWNIGTLAPGASLTVLAAVQLTGGLSSGRLIHFESELRADGVPMALGRHTLAVDGDNALSLGVRTDRDSIQPGEELNYILTYANRSASTINGTVLSFPLPDGASLLGYSAGATITGRTISWNLAGLLAGAGGQRSVRVRLAATPPADRQLRLNAAVVSGTSAVTGAEAARATLTTRITDGNPLRLQLLSLSANPILPGQTLTATLRVSNAGNDAINTVTLLARIPPEGIDGFYQTALSGGGICPSQGNTYCYPYQFARWNLGTLAAGAATTVTMPMEVSNGFGSGRLIALDAEVREDGGNQALVSGFVMAGSAFSAEPAFVPIDDTDPDNDGLRGFDDNCSLVANPNQRDTDNDGYGDVCDADFDNNGTVNFADLALFKLAFGSTNLLYDLDGNGVVNFADLARFKQRFGQPPGPSGKR